MNGKKIAIIIISAIVVTGAAYFGYRYFMYRSGNAEKDNRKIKLFRNSDVSTNEND